MIRQNKNRIPKEITASRPMLDKTVLRGFKEDSDEYRYLYNAMRSMSEEQLDHTAIIVRTNTHVSRISSYLSSHGVSCRGKSSPSREILSSIIRDLEAYRDLAAGLKARKIPRSALYRVMNRPERYLLRSAACKDYMSPVELLNDNRKNGNILQSLRELLRDLDTLGSLQPEGFVRYLTGPMGYGSWAAKRLGERETVESALSEVLKASRSAEDLDTLLDSLRRFPDRMNGAAPRGLRIMTMHACKGLEFDRVYLPALNEGIMPGRRCREQEDFEEERRLLYVAMTRARDHLELLYVTGTADNPRPPSRFLSVYGIRNFVS